jgi:hypothetical protein
MGKKFNNGFNFIGWMGFGGSIFQYHRELEIGYAYSMNMLHGEKEFNRCAEILKIKVYECARAENMKYK